MLVLPSFIGDQITMTDDIKCVTLLYPIKIITQNTNLYHKIKNVHF